MTTARDIVQSAVEIIGVYAAGETMSDADAERGLSTLNAMLDSWSNENLVAYAVQEQSFTLGVGTASYTIGSGGVVNVTRPFDIVQAYVRDTGNNNFLMRIVPRDKWNQIGNRGSTITSQIPNTLFYDPQYPLGVINIFPTPLIAYTLYFDSILQQSTFANLSTAFSAPPGYLEAYYTNLGVRLGPFFKDALVSEDVKEMARQAKAAIKRTNLREVIANYDSAVVARSYATYNIYSDSFGSRAT